MIRFRNPGVQINTQIEVFKELYKQFNGVEAFDLEDISSAISSANLCTAYGYGGENARNLSRNEDSSRDSVKMNAKMYAEVFRLLGWVASAKPGRSYPLRFTYIGEHIATADDVYPLYEECIFGIVNPNEVLNTKYTEEVRFFKTALRTLSDMDGILYKHELCFGPMNVNDIDENEYQEMLKKLRTYRGSYKTYQDKFAKLCQSLNVKKSLPDNSTRLPISYLKTFGMVEPIESGKVYPPKKLKCIQITDKGIAILDKLLEMKDLRLKEFQSYPLDIQQALIRLGVFGMLERAGFNVEKVNSIILADKELCQSILDGKELLFSPYQTLDCKAVDTALGIVVLRKDTINSTKGNTTINHLQRLEPKVSRISLYETNELSVSIEDKEIKQFKTKVEELKNKGWNKTNIINEFIKESLTQKCDEFYPFVATLFRICGFNCYASRQGDNGSRWDAIIVDDHESVPIEIKSPTEELHISMKAIRQALENKIVLLSRKTYPTKIESSSLVVGNQYPNDRSEVNQAIFNYKEVYGVTIGLIDLHTLLFLAVTSILDGTIPKREEILHLEGFANANI